MKYPFLNNFHFVYEHHNRNLPDNKKVIHLQPAQKSFNEDIYCQTEHLFIQPFFRLLQKDTCSVYWFIEK